MKRESSVYRSILILVLWIALAAPAARAGRAARPPEEPESALDRVLDRIVAREQGLLDRLREYRPLVETYLQSVKPDGPMGQVPIKDQYFLGRLNLGRRPVRDREDGKRKSKSRPASNEKLVDLYQYSVASNPDGFARMLTLDATSFDREHYEFSFVRREFLGEIRTLVFDVMPAKVKGAKPGRFAGRIWVEDQGYNIVRYNGLYGSIFRTNLHFDSWRVNVGRDLWLPAYVYTEEPERPGGHPRIKLTGQTRIWGYDFERQSAEEEFTKVMIDADLAEDASEQSGRISPVESYRAWKLEAEENVLHRLERAGLLAPPGEVDGVLETVVANLELTNDLEIYPPIRCRVLLTTPLESFTVGHTIVLSRGLIDVLPDEASLALVLAHELGHVLSGHLLDTKYAFSDQMLVDDKTALQQFDLQRDPEEEREADERSVDLLRNSPYKDKLANAGLFLKSLQSRSEALAALIRPHFGNRLGMRDRIERLRGIVDAAPELDPAALDQIAALPLGGRVKVDPATGQVELMKTQRVALLSAREKMPFQVTPLMPHLVRFRVPGESAPELQQQIGELRTDSR